MPESSVDTAMTGDDNTITSTTTSPFPNFPDQPSTAEAPPTKDPVLLEYEVSDDMGREHCFKSSCNGRISRTALRRNLLSYEIPLTITGKGESLCAELKFCKKVKSLRQQASQSPQADLTQERMYATTGRFTAASSKLDTNEYSKILTEDGSLSVYVPHEDYRLDHASRDFDIFPPKIKERTLQYLWNAKRENHYYFLQKIETTKAEEPDEESQLWQFRRCEVDHSGRTDRILPRETPAITFSFTSRIGTTREDISIEDTLAMINQSKEKNTYRYIKQ